MDGRDWYEAWVIAHCGAFGVAVPEWVDAMLAWRRAFCLAGYTAGELHEATDRIISGAVTPRFPHEHLSAVKRAVAEIRREAAAGRDAGRAAYDRPACELCGGSGWVVVPHPTGVRDGEWASDRTNAAGNPVFVTGAVACRCEVGRRAQDAAPLERRPLDLGRYELRVDAAWADHLAEREAARAEMTRAEAAAVAARVPDLVRQIAARAAVGRLR